LAFERLVIVPPGNQRSERSELELGGPAGATSWGDWRIRWKREVAPGGQARTGDTAWFSEGGLAVRAPRAGDRLVPLGGTGRRLAVRCFQEARVPRHERADWPVIASPEGIAWIPGVCRSTARCPVEGAPAIRVDVERAG
jgi:tRNA(Ile)-lysidine synthase